MPFNHNLSKLRMLGRKAVLPIGRIQAILAEIISHGTTIIDFGSGTLFWSSYFVEEFDAKVYAVDSYYTVNMPRPDSPNIVCSDDIKQVLQTSSAKTIWISDVIHHLEPLFWDKCLKDILDKVDTIIIKDIDCGYKAGNFMNRFHDRIINGEKIYDVSVEQLTTKLTSHSFVCKEYSIHKLWYPHFLLIAFRM